MNRLFPHALPVAVFCLSLAWFSPAKAQPWGALQPRARPTLGFSRVLLVSGGPDARNNQYAIESNARYVASLTRNAKWRRVLFADGKSTSRTIAAIVDTPRTRARAVASWIGELDPPAETVALRAPTLWPLNGAATPASIGQNLAAFAKSDDANRRQAPGNRAQQRELVYFTGHGSPGRTFLGDDFDNTLYAAWEGDFSTRELARDLQRSKSKAPLVLVMVQCHGGGFANAMFQNGDPNKPLWNRDFCGFFASTAPRPAAGCTSQVNERDYQDFTTHFFAALSGISRDGRPVSGADYDRDGRVSLAEAFAYANINDDSIDVPLCTSDAFLRRIFTPEGNAWHQTSFSLLRRNAAPWQRALLDGLGARLNLSGDRRLQLAQKRLEAVLQSEETERKFSQWKMPEGVNAREFVGAYNRLKNGLGARFPGFGTKGASQSRFLGGATTFVASQTRDLNIVYGAYNKSASQKGEVEEAQLLRFLRCARSLVLEERLAREGTPAQKAGFARLRTSENRGAF